MNDLPEIAQLEKELDRVRYRSRFGTVLRSTIYTLITVAAGSDSYFVASGTSDIRVVHDPDSRGWRDYFYNKDIRL